MAKIEMGLDFKSSICKEIEEMRETGGGKGMKNAENHGNQKRKQ